MLLFVRKRQNEVSVEECNSYVFISMMLISAAYSMEEKCKKDIDCCEMAYKNIKKFPLPDSEKKFWIDAIERDVENHNKYGIN